MLFLAGEGEGNRVWYVLFVTLYFAPIKIRCYILYHIVYDIVYDIVCNIVIEYAIIYDMYDT